MIGGLALIGSPAPLAPSSPPDPSTGGPSVYLSPKTRPSDPSTPSTPEVISVDVKVDEIPSPAVEGHGLGGYQFTLSWDHVPEDVTITL